MKMAELSVAVWPAPRFLFSTEDMFGEGTAPFSTEELLWRSGEW